MQNDPEWNDGFTTGLVVMTIAIVLVLIGIANLAIRWEHKWLTTFSNLLREAIDSTESTINHLKMSNKYMESQIKLACIVFRGLYDTMKADPTAPEDGKQMVMDFLARNDTTGWLP